MGINEFKTFALQTMCEAHLWKPGERTVFSLKGREYLIVKWENNWSLAERKSKYDMWGAPIEFPDSNRLFRYIFNNRLISYN